MQPPPPPLIVPPSVPVSSSPELIVPILGDVSHPGQGLVPRLLYDLQVPHLTSRSIRKTSSTYLAWQLLT